MAGTFLFSIPGNMPNQPFARTLVQCPLAREHSAQIPRYVMDLRCADLFVELVGEMHPFVEQSASQRVAYDNGCGIQCVYHSESDIDLLLYECTTFVGSQQNPNTALVCFPDAEQVEMAPRHADSFGHAADRCEIGMPSAVILAQCVGSVIPFCERGIQSDEQQTVFQSGGGHNRRLRTKLLSGVFLPKRKHFVIVG